MIFKSSFPNSPTVKITIDGVPVDYTSIESIQFSFSENEHDFAEFTFTGLVPKAVTDYLNRPVFISIQYSPTQVSNFYGYISFIEPEAITRKGYVNKSPIQKAHVVCFGASYDMKAKKSRSWDLQNIKNIVSTIATEYSYSYAVPDDSFIISRLVQSQESDWELLVKACSMLGYRVTASGGHIHVYDPYKTISRAMPYAELTTLSNEQGNASYYPGRVMEFRGTFGSLTPLGSSNTFTFETLDNDGKLLTYSTDGESMGLGLVFPARFNDTVTFNTTSKEALEKYALATKKNRAPFHAGVTVTGIPEIIPGSLVKLSKYDSRFDGFWMVQKVTQKVTRSNYITELCIVRDSTNESNPVIANGQPYVFPDPPVLKKGVWVAETRTENVYA